MVVFKVVITDSIQEVKALKGRLNWEADLWGVAVPATAAILEKVSQEFIECWKQNLKTEYCCSKVTRDKVLKVNFLKLWQVGV